MKDDDDDGVVYCPICHVPRSGPNARNHTWDCVTEIRGDRK